MTIKELLNSSQAKYIPLLLMEYAGCKQYTHLIEPEKEIEGEQLEKILNALKELESERPIQYILGYEEFAGLKIKVSEDVLIPRPETEELVHLIAKENRDIKNPRILDICSGSGAISYALASLLSANNPIIKGLEISDSALIIAKNQNLNNIPEDIYPQFIKCDILTNNIEIASNEQYDIIVSNPPYVCEKEKGQMQNNVLSYEPHIALFVKDEDPLLFYKRIIQLSVSILKNNGKLYFEINEKYGKNIAELMKENGFTDCKIVKDFREKDRFVFGKLKK